MTDCLPSRLFRIASVLAAVALMALPAQAQMEEDPITSDRPGFSNAAATVSQGTLQAELGYDFTSAESESFSDESVATHSVGLLLLRYGVTDAIELRANVGSAGFAETLSAVDGALDTESEFESGYNGASAEIKARLFQNTTTTVSAFSATTLPLATGPFEQTNDAGGTDERARQTLALLLDGSLGQNITLTLNGGASFFWDSGVQEDRATSGIFIPTLSFSINDQAGAYVGYFGEYTKSINVNFVEGGFTYLVSNDTQVDINGGFRVDDNRDGFFVGLGLSQRF